LKNLVREQDFNLRRNTLRLEILHEITLSLAQLGRPEQVATQLLALLPGIIDVKAITLHTQTEGKHLILSGTLGISSPALDLLPKHWLNATIKSGKPCIYKYSKFLQHLGFSEVLIVPIRSNYEFYGLLTLFDRESRKGTIPFSTEDAELMESIASIVAVAIHNGRLYSQVLDEKTEKDILLNTAPVAIISTDIYGRITAFNETAAQRLGFTELHIKNKYLWERLIKGVPNQCPYYDRNLTFRVPKGSICGDINIVYIYDHHNNHRGKLITIQDLSETNRIKEIFQQYVSESIVKMLLEDPDQIKLGGVSKYATILFADIRRFTIISRELTAEQTVSLLNEFLAEMVNVIKAHNGTVDKIIGDSIMAVFGVPLSSEDDTQRSVNCAIAMMKAMAKINKKLSQKNLPPLSIGIGIDQGVVISGNIGSPSQMQYTVIGNAANSASHICAKAEPYEVLITSDIYARVVEKSYFTYTDHIYLKNENEPIRLYSLLFRKMKPK
jgi:adenylate cyclase